MIKFTGIWAIFAWIYLKVEDIIADIKRIFTRIRYNRMRKK